MDATRTFLPPALRILPPAESAPGGKVFPLTPGEILEGTILERKAPDQILVRIKGQDLWARSQIPLPGVGKISLQVESVGPQVLLRFLTAVEEGEAGSLGPLKRMLGDGVPLDRSSLAPHFRLHLHRGIGYLSDKNVSDIGNLTRLAKSRAESGRSRNWRDVLYSFEATF